MSLLTSQTAEFLALSFAARGLPMIDESSLCGMMRSLSVVAEPVQGPRGFSHITLTTGVFHLSMSFKLLITGSTFTPQILLNLYRYLFNNDFKLTVYYIYSYI